MYKFKTISGDWDWDWDCYPPSGVSPYPSPILHSHAESDGETDYHRIYPTCHTSLPFPRQPVLSIPTADQSLVNIQQPPVHVVDYWFDRLGLSLDPASSENPSNIPPPGLPLLDDIDAHVSLLCSHNIIQLSSRGSVDAMSRFPDWFPLASLWNLNCQKEFPRRTCDFEFRTQRGLCASLSLRSSQVLAIAVSRSGTPPIAGRLRKERTESL